MDTGLLIAGLIGALGVISLARRFTKRRDVADFRLADISPPLVDLDFLADHFRAVEQDMMAMLNALRPPPPPPPPFVPLGLAGGYVPFAQATQESCLAREAAIIKSEAYLKRWLSAEQYAEWEDRRHFHVIGGITGKRYRICNPSAPHNVLELDDSGTVTARLCFVPKQNVPYTPYPPCDVAVMQKLMLEHDENEALRIANRAPLVPLTMQSITDALRAMAQQTVHPGDISA